MMAKMLPKTCHWAVAVMVAVVLVPALPVSAVVTYDTRALSDDPAPGTNRVYSSFAAPMIDGTGQTAFRAITSASDRGLWSEGSGSLSLVALDGTIAPDTTGVYNFLDKLVLNSAGKVAFVNHLLIGTGGVTGADNVGIWSDRSGPLSLIVREGDPAPGTGGAFGSMNSPVFNGAGQIAFMSGASIWSDGSGSLSLIARQGDAAPGTAAGVVYNSLFNNPVINGAGQTAFLLSLTGTGVTAANDWGIWSEGSGSLSLVAREGSAAPGTAGGVFNVFFGSPTINDAGQTTFTGSLLAGTGDVTSDNDFGIWSGDTGSLDLVVRKGDPAPGTAAVYGGFEHSVINGAGQIAFQGGLTGPGVTSSNNESIWLEDSGSLNLIAREGFAAPGTDSVFRSFSSTSSFPILNGAGQVAFSGVTSNGDRGIWATDTNGQLTLIVREGDQIDVNNDPLIDDFRTIRKVDMVTRWTGGEDGLGTPFNDAGQIAFRLTFTSDGSSGIFVASIQTALIGDINGDGFVDILDLNIVLANWNTDGTGDPRTDTDDSGLVDILDLNAVLTNWNSGTPPADGATIPEPASLTLLGAGVLSLVPLRHRRGPVSS